MRNEKRPEPVAAGNRAPKNKTKNHPNDTEKNPPNEVARPAVQLRHGKLGDAVHEAARILRKADVGIYRWGGRLVRLLVVPPAPQKSPIKRDPSMQMLVGVTPGWVTLQLCDVATWWRWDGRARDWRAADPPPRLAALLVEGGDGCDFRVLSARASCPQLLPDGQIQGHGYHPDTQLLVDAPGEWPAPPEAPSRQDAEQALIRLRERYRYYPWATAAAESAAIAMLLTACLRPTLGIAPGFAITAPLSGAGTGKSLLVQAISIVATGRTPTIINWPTIPGEGSKRLDGTHLAGDPIIAIDNLSGQFGDDTLCTSLTAHSRDIRELGSSRTVRTPMLALHLLTGNGLRLGGDLTRRILVVHIDPQTDTPDQREIPQDLIGECRASRSEIVCDVHTLLRAYLAAGEPDMGLRPLGDYADWTRRVRSPLVWLGLPDPVATQEALRADDPQREARAALFLAWRGAFGIEGATAREAVELIAGGPAYHRMSADEVEALRDALEAVAMRRGQLDTCALGRWLRTAKGARVGDLVLCARSARGGRMRWIVAQEGGDDRDTPLTFDQKMAGGKNDKYTEGRREYTRLSRPTDPLATVLAAAVSGLDVTAEQLLTALSQADLAEIASGVIGIETLRAYARELCRGGPSEH